LVVTIRKYKFPFLKENILNDQQQRLQKAIEYLLTHEKITNSEYRKLNPKIDRIVAKNELKDLTNKCIILAKGKRKSSYYVLNE
jgi:hypothetical protein